MHILLYCMLSRIYHEHFYPFILLLFLPFPFLSRVKIRGGKKKKKKKVSFAFPFSTMNQGVALERSNMKRKDLMASWAVLQR